MKVQDNEKQGEGGEEIIETKSSGTLEKKDLKKTDNLDSDIQDQNTNKKQKTDTLTSESDVASKPSKKSSGKIKSKVEDYDLIAGSLKEGTISFKQAIISIGKKAQEIKGKAKETFTVGAKKDARDIQALGEYLEKIVKGFEDTMTEIERRDYVDQAKLLKGYKKLLEEQINLINARMELVKRLKSA
jgi:hypothetical protein